MAIILDGKALAAKIRNNLKKRVKKLYKIPLLGIVHVGDEDAASDVYIRNKVKACEEIGAGSEVIRLPSTISEDGVINLLNSLNSSVITGYIVQLPLPPNFDSKKILSRIYPSKDLDGLSEYNMGKLLLGVDRGIQPATPKGIVRLLDEYMVPIEGKNVCIIGRSDIVGKPLAAMMINKGATVSVCNSKTENIGNYTSQADILIVAAGVPNLINEYTCVKRDAAIIDVGMNRVDGKLVGDVNPSVADRVKYITPVPGGVGPMTVAMLMENLVEAGR